MSRIAILGGGSWGTALAIVLARARSKHEVSLWVRDPALADSISRERENRTYLPGHPLTPGVRVTCHIHEALANATLVVGAIPAAYARNVYSAAAAHVSAHSVFVSATKGLEPATHKRMSEVLVEVFEGKFVPRLAVLSGPSFAAEVARGEPTAVVLASRDAPLAAELQEEFAAPNFRLYTNDDVLGVEAEMSRLAAALGAQPETLTGLAGLGDLVLTCTGALSRNRQVGIELGRGRALTEILAGMRMVAEGVGTTAALLALAREAKVELPITEQVDAILSDGKSPREAIRDIMDRPQKRE